VVGARRRDQIGRHAESSRRGQLLQAGLPVETGAQRRCGVEQAAEEPQASERESFNRLVAEGEHIMNAEIALFRAGIPFLQLPFQQNKFASNLFMVLNVSKARACLQRAGFQPKVDSETVLFDSRNGQPIQLIQGRYGLPRAKS